MTTRHNALRLTRSTYDTVWDSVFGDPMDTAHCGKERARWRDDWIVMWVAGGGPGANEAGRMVARFIRKEELRA